MNWWMILFSAQGRIRRSEYALWSFGFTIFVIAMVLALDNFVSGLTIPYSSYWLYGGALFTWLWGLGCLTVKRWHDRDKTGWLCLLILIPVAGIIITAVECGLVEGSPGQNRHGTSPKLMNAMPGIF